MTLTPWNPEDKEIPNMTNIYSFALGFSSLGKAQISAALFPFIMDSVPVPGISCLISSRSAGDMKIADTEEPNPCRQGLFDALGLDYGRVSFLEQIHSRRVLAAESRNLRCFARADGLVTGDPNIILSVTVADCLPVFLYDTGSRGFGLLHSGWKGTGIVLDALQKMKESRGTKPGAVAAVLGPCIQSCCYRVDEERAVSFEKEFGGSGNFAADDLGDAKGNTLPGPVTLTRDNGYYLDLQAANIRLLVNAGVRNIAVCRDCTFTDTRLGSFRREGPGYTRMMALCGNIDIPNG